MTKITISLLFAIMLLLPMTGCASEPLPPRGTSPANPNYIEPQTYNFKNQPDGFDGVKWGSTLEEAELIMKTKFELDYESKPTGSKFFRIPGHKTIFLGVHLPEVDYIFNKNKLTSIKVENIPDPDRKIFDNLFKAMTDTYDPHTHILKYKSGDIYQWRGTKTYMALSYDSEDKYTFIDFMSPSIAYFSVYYVEHEKEQQSQKTQP